ncbi:MAG: 5-oxoprolinase subunit PxpB [Deltaproteobacteria bacterium]|nr:5-oxoprolinase subunit PxpB [Deltaproteobacteria bacterium]
MYKEARYLIAGDKGLLVEYGDKIDPEINAKVRAISLSIEKADIDGVEEVIPTYRSILITYNPTKISFKDLKENIKNMEKNLSKIELPAPRTIEIPVVYGGEYGPDIEFVAKHNGLTVEEVIDIHSKGKYLIYMIGFTPGFPFLGGLSEKLFTPRLETPRVKVPAGSVGIANNQTGIYPIDSPGGWRIIGRTPIKLYDPSKDPPVILSPGDFIRFVPIDEEEYKKMLKN